MPNPTDDRVRDLVMARYKHSRDSFTAYHHKAVRLYNAYRMWNRGSYQAHRNNITVPMIFSMVWSDIARKTQTSFKSNDVIDVFGYGPEDRAVAEKNRILLNAELKDTRIFQKAIANMANGDIAGAGITQTGWKHEEKTLKQRSSQAHPITGELLEQVRARKVTTFDGPDVRVWDPVDVFPQPGVPDPFDLEWVIVKYVLNMDDIEALVAAEHFDASGMSGLRFAGEMAHAHRQFRETDEHKDARYNAETRLSNETRPLHERSVVLHEMWGIAPSDFADEEGIIDRVITIANGQVVMRNRPIPFDHGRIPFHFYRPTPDQHFLFGPSKADIIEKFQWSASRLASAKLDILDLNADPMWYSNRFANVDRRNLTTAPGRILEGDGAPGEAFMPISPDLRAMQNLYPEIDWLDRQGQKTSGIVDDVVSGFGGGGDQTAREFVGRQENVSIRLMLESRILEETWLEPLVRDFISLNQQFLETPREISMLGGNIFDPHTGEPLPMEEARINDDDLNLDYDVRARGSSQILPQAIKQQNWALLSQQINANPLNLQMINQEAFLRETFRLFDVTDVDTFLNVPPKQQVALQNAVQSGIIGSGGGGENAQAGGQVGDATNLSPIGGMEGINATLTT